MVLVSGQTKVWEALSGLSGGKYISPLEVRNGQRGYSARRRKLRDIRVRVGERAPIPLDALVRIVKVWDRLKRKGNSQGRVGGGIVNPGAV